MQEIQGLVRAAVLGVVEGLTEFLPVSSTGHLILAGEVLGLTGEKAKTFHIFIQLGAILAVVWDRRAILLPGRRFAPRVLLLTCLAFLPAAVLGLLAHRPIKEHLFTSPVVATSLILGALVIWGVERSPRVPGTSRLEDIDARRAVGVGLCQCLALVPGVSRAAATILGGMLLGLSRPVATEFSFLLAIPTLGAASLFDLVSSRDVLTAADLPVFAVGFGVSFLVALLVVRWLIRYVQNHDFRPFVWWRLAVGLTVLVVLRGRRLSP